MSVRDGDACEATSGLIARATLLAATLTVLETSWACCATCCWPDSSARPARLTRFSWRGRCRKQLSPLLIEGAMTFRWCPSSSGPWPSRAGLAGSSGRPFPGLPGYLAHRRWCGARRSRAGPPPRTRPRRGGPRRAVHARHVGHGAGLGLAALSAPLCARWTSLAGPLQSISRTTWASWPRLSCYIANSAYSRRRSALLWAACSWSPSKRPFCVGWTSEP